MDFQPTEHITKTQAIGDDSRNPNSTAPQMAAHLSPEYTALCADIEIITSSVLEQFAQTIFTEITELFAKNNTALQNSTNSLTKQIASLSTRVTPMQQQLLSAGWGAATTTKSPQGLSNTNISPKKERRRKGRRATDKNPNHNSLATNTGPNTYTYANAARTPPAQPHLPTEQATHATNTEGWENLRKKSQGKKTAAPNSSRPCSPKPNTKSLAISWLPPPLKPPPMPNETTPPARSSPTLPCTESTKPWLTTRM